MQYFIYSECRYKNCHHNNSNCNYNMYQWDIPRLHTMISNPGFPKCENPDNQAT